MHTRDYSEDTSRVIDAEMSRILREQDERAIELLTRHRGGLDAVARALLERETLDGEEVARLVDTAYGRPVHDNGTAQLARFAGASGGNGASGTEDGDGNGVGRDGAAGPDTPAEPAGTTTD